MITAAKWRRRPRPPSDHRRRPYPGTAGTDGVIVTYPPTAPPQDRFTFVAGEPGSAEAIASRGKAPGGERLGQAAMESGD